MHNAPGLEDHMLWHPQAKVNTCQMMPSVSWNLCEHINDKEVIFSQREV